MTNKTFTNIFEAAQDGSVEDIKYFIETLGIDVNTANATEFSEVPGHGRVPCMEFGNTPLHEAALENKNVDVLKYLLSKGAKINAKNGTGCTPLHEATGSNQSVEIFQFLVSKGADVNSKNNAGDTLLHDAVYNDNVEIVKWLVSVGADVNAVDADGWTPLDLAKGNGKTEMAEYLDSVRTCSFTPVEQAEIDKFCEMHGCDVHAVDHNGEPYLLHEAAAHWDVAVVKHLVSLGADVNAIKEGFTPLMSAIADNPSIEVSKYLVSVGAYFQSEHDSKKDLLAFAEEMENHAVVEYLAGTKS